MYLSLTDLGEGIFGEIYHVLNHDEEVVVYLAIRELTEKKRTQEKKYIKMKKCRDILDELGNASCLKDDPWF